MARYMDVSRTLSASSAVCATASAAVVRRRCHFVMLQQHRGKTIQLQSRCLEVSRAYSAFSDACKTASAAVVPRRCHVVMLYTHKANRHQLCRTCMHCLHNSKRAPTQEAWSMARVSAWSKLCFSRLLRW